jgi:hypothetical protein
MISKRILATWFGAHFLLVTAVCFGDIFSLTAQGLTILPSAVVGHARTGELAGEWVSGKKMAASNPVRRLIATYLDAAGSQAGYSFFAPNIPGYHKLILELYYDDGRVGYDSPHVRGEAAALRLDSLLDRLANPRYGPLREVVVKMLTFSVWQGKPDVKKVRAIFGAVNQPSISDFERGKRESFQPLFSFDFSLRDQENQ